MLKEFQKDKEITEDEEKQGLKKVQDATDAAVAKVDEIVAKKEKEILEV
jgi:ribosome recycling factor